jgi:hypothetical protein
MQLTPIKINHYPGVSMAMGIRRFIGYVEDIIQRRPNYGNTFFKTHEGRNIVLSIDLKDEEIDALKDLEDDFEFEIIDQPWDEICKARKPNKTDKDGRKKNK